MRQNENLCYVFVRVVFAGLSSLSLGLYMTNEVNVHDSSLSGGQTHLRSVKVAELSYDASGQINTIDGTR